MGIKTKHGARGSMILNYDWEEDNQAVNEYYNNCASIEADPKDDSYIIMTIENGKHDFRKGHRHECNHIRISTYDLINLIKANGVEN